jgi:energy-coupling factor transporter transmembrane protein EcfT
MAQIDLFSYNFIDTPFHRMHPVLKIAILSITSFKIITGTYSLPYVVILSLIFIHRSKMIITPGVLKYTLVIAILVFIFFLFNSEVSLLDNILQSTIYALRIGGLILLSRLFIFTTSLQDISQGVLIITRNKKIAEIVSLCLNLFPAFTLGINRIFTSLRSRGLFRIKNPYYFLKYLVTPVFIETFKKTHDYSIAMESRGYNGYIEREISHSQIIIYPIIFLLPSFLLDFLPQIKMLLHMG